VDLNHADHFTRYPPWRDFDRYFEMQIAIKSQKFVSRTGDAPLNQNVKAYSDSSCRCRTFNNLAAMMMPQASGPERKISIFQRSVTKVRSIDCLEAHFQDGEDL
jgi:hypothetical protein